MEMAFLAGGALCAALLAYGGWLCLRAALRGEDIGTAKRSR
jgi:hypothetical protein